VKSYLQNNNWWRRLNCRLNKHEDVLFFVGMNFGKECRWCSRHGVLTVDEVHQIRKQQWTDYGLRGKDSYTYVRITGGKEAETG